MSRHLALLVHQLLYILMWFHINLFLNFITWLGWLAFYIKVAASWLIILGPGYILDSVHGPSALQGHSSPDWSLSLLPLYAFLPVIWVMLTMQMWPDWRIVQTFLLLLGSALFSKAHTMWGWDKSSRWSYWWKRRWEIVVNFFRRSAIVVCAWNSEPVRQTLHLS